jgi:hypothetical protein
MKENVLHLEVRDALRARREGAKMLHVRRRLELAQVCLLCIVPLGSSYS